MNGKISLLVILFVGFISAPSFAQAPGVHMLLEPGCESDGDEDGYGAPASPECNYPDLDCDDTNPNVNPGVIESKDVGNCADVLDNDCDGLADAADPDCPGSCFLSSAI
ncbi:hypothetical protein ACFL4G_11010 [Thermodesulfobacteriota bacterium]